MEHIGGSNSHVLRCTRRRRSHLPELTHDDVLHLCSLYENRDPLYENRDPLYETRDTAVAEGTAEVVTIDLSSSFDDAEAATESHANTSLGAAARIRNLGQQHESDQSDLDTWFTDMDFIDLCSPIKGVGSQKQSESNTPTCPICFESLFSGSEVVTTRCGHIFCSPCITNALEINHLCPICRKRQLAKNLITVFLDSNFNS